MFGGGMSERTIGKLCDENWNPNLLLYCDQTKSGIPFRTQFKIAGTVPLKYAIAVSVSFQSLPGYRFGTAALNIDTGIVAGPSGQPGATSLANPNGAGTVWLITPTTRYTVCPGNSASQGCVVGALVDPGLTVASLSVPLVAPQTEFGDRINQLDLNVTKTIRIGRASFQPKIDFFNLLNAVVGLRRPHPQLRHHGVQPAFVDSGRPRVPAWSDREVLISASVSWSIRSSIRRPPGPLRSTRGGPFHCRGSASTRTWNPSMHVVPRRVVLLLRRAAGHSAAFAE